MISPETIMHFLDRFHLFAGLPFLSREIWHFADHAYRALRHKGHR